MAKLDILQLRKLIGREEFDHPLLSSALSRYRAPDQKINELLKSKAIIRVKKGLYVFGSESRQTPICKESIANLIYGPSYISMEYALSFHGLIPERVEIVTSVTPKRDKIFDTPLGRFTYRYIHPRKYPHGIQQHWVDRQHPILIATPAKALCDYIALNDISRFAQAKDARRFLQDDLRIPVETWERFDLKEMVRINGYFKNPAISSIVEIL